MFVGVYMVCLMFEWCGFGRVIGGCDVEKYVSLRLVCEKGLVGGYVECDVGESCGEWFCDYSWFGWCGRWVFCLVWCEVEEDF